MAWVTWGTLALLAVSAVAALNTELPPLQICRLSNGTQFSLLALTQGRHHHFTIGKPAARRLSPLLPAGWASKLGWRTTELSYESPNRDELVFWFKVNGADGPQAVTCLDEAGNETDRGLVQFTASAGCPDGYTAWTVPVFPRRGRRLGLRFWRQSQSAVTVLGELWVPNPQPASGPTWTPAQLPQTARAGDLEVTLLSLVAGVSPSEPWRPAPDPLTSGTRALLRLRERGRPTQHWQPVQITCSDASGNRWTADIWCPPDNRGPLVAVLPRLWPGESAWKLRFGLIRNDGFSPADQSRPLSLAMPADGFLEPVQRESLHGATLEIGAVTHVPGPPVSAVWVQGNTTNVPKGYRLDAVQATSHGRSVNGAIIAGLGGNGVSADRLDPSDGGILFQVPYSGHPKSIDLTFAIQKPRFVEFTVKPDFLPARSEQHRDRN